MGKPALNYGSVVNIKRHESDIICIKVENKMTTEKAEPGQFVNVSCCGKNGAFLRRPLSIAAVDEKNGTFDICFEIKGKGTKELSFIKKGGTVDFIGPLGRRWNIGNLEHHALVGGGIGVFPLYFLAQRLLENNKKADIFLGYRTKGKAAYYEEFKNLGIDVHIATDDGSLGKKGFVTDIFENQLKRNKKYSVYTCGPEIMMEKTALLCDKYNINCQVSMERRMGCGIGACLVCSCKVKTKNEDGWEYKKACSDGPVFNSKEIIWE